MRNYAPKSVHLTANRYSGTGKGTIVIAGRLQIIKVDGYLQPLAYRRAIARRTTATRSSDLAQETPASNSIRRERNALPRPSLFLC
jgi:hypothetical protein